MTDADQKEPVGQDMKTSDPLNDERADPGAAGVPASNQRLRAILAGLVTVAILAVLAIAVFSGDDDNTPEPLATTASSDGSGGQQEGSGASTGSEEPGGEELGSLAVSGYLCPEATSDESACLDAGPVAISGATVRLVDGRIYAMEGVEQDADGMYAWLNIPIGEYTLLAAGLSGPDGSAPRAVIGSNGQTAEGWLIANLDPNQPAEIRIIFAPAGSGTPAGEETAVG